MLPVLATDSVTDDLARAVGYTLLWGLEGVAVRTVGGERVPFVNEAALRRRLDENDLPLAAVDPGLFEGDAGRRAVWLNDVAAFDDTAAFCQRLGCSLVRIGALGAGGTDDERVTALRALGDAASRHGLRLAVRNEAGSAVQTGADLAGLLGRVAHPAVGADWRPSEAARAGEDAGAGLGSLLASAVVACVDVVDVRPDADGAAVVPAGAVAWPEQLDRLAAAGFDGPLVLGVPARPAGPAGLAEASALVRLARQARREAAGA